MSALALENGILRWGAVAVFSILGIAIIIMVVVRARIARNDQEAANKRQERLQESLDETRLDSAKSTSFLSGQVTTLTDLIAHPPPNEDLRRIAEEIRQAGAGSPQLSNAEWRDAALALADRLRKFQLKTTGESDRSSWSCYERGIEAFRKGDKDGARKVTSDYMLEHQNLHSRRTNEFGPLRVESLQMRTQLLARLPPQPDDVLSRDAGMVLDSGFLAGPSPVSGLADYIERLARLLPVPSAN